MLRLANCILLSLGIAALATGARSVAFAQANPAGSAKPDASDLRQGSTGAGGPTLQVYSRLTVVDVTVTDAKGQPIHDLKQSDFTVKEDGKAQPINSFSEVREDLPIR